MTLSAMTPTTVDEIVDSLKVHVWTLLRADNVAAAMVLLAASIPDYLRVTGQDQQPHWAVDPRVSVPVEVQVMPEGQPLEGVLVDSPEQGASPGGVPLAMLLANDTPTWSIPLPPGKVKMRIRKGA